MDIVAEYAAALEISQRMLAMARIGAWDELVELEKRRVDIMGAIRNSQLEVLPAQRQECEQMIRQILACDQEVRQLVEPWMSEVSEILGSLHAARKLQEVYK